MDRSEHRRLLLCELHAHTTWSDGVCSVAEVVDLYGGQGFDVLCITDHTVREDDPYLERGLAIDRGHWQAYLAEIDAESRRARERFGMLVIPGLELTDNAPDPDEAAHALAIGLRRFVAVEGDLVDGMLAARTAGAAIVAAHPHGPATAGLPRATRRFWHQRRELAGLVDRYELFNRMQVFGWVAEAGLPAIATGDFHRPEHLPSWKTALPCAKSEDAVVEYLTSTGRAYLVPLAAPLPPVELAA
jgi:predicted metal-dependent phosphoesterase TrpH